jgi:hypothetical protein
MPNWQNRLDFGGISPTQRVAENQKGRRVYFEASDIPHARDIIEDRGPMASTTMRCA